jgi:hypothetical protein
VETHLNRLETIKSSYESRVKCLEDDITRLRICIQHIEIGKPHISRPKKSRGLDLVHAVLQRSAGNSFLKQGMIEYASVRIIQAL